MKKLMGSKRIAALLLALCLMLSALPVPAAATDSQPGYFYLSVVTNQKTVISPVRIIQQLLPGKQFTASRDPYSHTIIE